MADVSQIKLPNGTTYTLKDEGALQLTGGNVTGPVSFGDSVSIDSATIGNLVVNGGASFVNSKAIANQLIDSLDTASADWTDNTLILTSDSTGDTNLYYRRAAVKAWNYINSKISAAGYTKNTGTITSVKTTAGAHTTINTTSGAVSFNVPTTAAHVGALASNGTAVAASTLAHKTLDNTTINNTAGTFAFSGSGEPWAGTDWVGFQVGDSADKFQFTRTGTAPMFRYNDSGGTNSSNWSDWSTLYSTSNKPTAADIGIKFGYTTSGNNRAVLQDSSGNLYVIQKDDNTTALTSMTGTLGVDHGGTGKTSALAAITNLGGPYLLAQGTEITASSNLDTAYKAMGTYYSGDSTRSGTLAGTVPVTGSGFKMITAIGYRTATLRQFIGGANNDLFYRSSQDTGSTWTKWYKFALLPSGSDNKTFAAVGGTTTPVYVSASGVVTACSYTIAKSVPADAKFTDSGGTVTSITLTQGTGISIGSSGTAITTSGSRTISLATITKSDTTSTASPAHGGTFTAIDSITYDSYGRVTGVNTKTVTLPASGNTDTKVKITAVTPESETTNYVLTHTATSGTTDVDAHAYNRFWYKQGSTSVNGYVYAGFGNNIATGTANNSQGYVRLYGPNTGYGNITYANATANSTHTLPSTGGTILNTGTTSFTQSLTSGTKVGTIKINGTETILYAPTNTNTTYSAGTGLSLSSTTFSLATSGVTAGSYGAVNNTETTLSGHSTIYELGITVDKYGRVTDVKAKPKNIFSGDILCAHAASSTSTTIPKSTITQIPLTQTLVSRDYHSNLSLASNRIAIANAGTYRITGSIYMSTTAASTVGVYIMKGTGAFSSATEITSSYIYIGIAGTTSINVTKTIEAAAGTYIYLAARASNGGTVASGNTATYLEVEELRF